MKKLRLFCFIAAAVLAATAFSSCKVNINVNSTSSATESEAADTTAGNSDADISGTGKMFDTVEDYYNYPNTQKSLKNAIKSLPDTITLNAHADETTFYYDYTYTDTYEGKFLKQVKKNLDASDLSSSIVPLMKELDKYVDEENPVVYVRYYNGDGELITEKSFDKSILD